MGAVSQPQVTVATAQIKRIVGDCDWRDVASRMQRAPSTIERAMRRDAINLALADELLVFLGRPDAVTVLVRCVAHPCVECGAPLLGGRCPECDPDLVCLTVGCVEHVVIAGLCGWCVEEAALVLAAA